MEDRFETEDGSRPDATVLPDADGAALPLAAFGVLRGGDVFEPGAAGAPRGAEAARAWRSSRVTVSAHGASDGQAARVERDLERLVAGNPQLAARLARAKPVHIDLVPAGRSISTYGYPTAVSASAAGLYWDHPAWPQARIALRQDRLDQDPVLVIHEGAHAVHYLAFTAAERALIYRHLRPTFGSVAAMDEVFAVYSEREFVVRFAKDELRAPGVYGAARRGWSDDHVFTRFVRRLYFPHAPAAGPGMKPVRADSWMKGLGR